MSNPDGNAFDWGAEAGQNAWGQLASSGNTVDHMATYENPYTDTVIDRSAQDMLRANDMAQDQLGAQAMQAGAFGGDRHGIAQGQMTSDLVRNQGNMAAGLRHQGFNTAANLAQGHVGQDMSLANAWSNASNSLYDRGRQAMADQDAAGAGAQGQSQAVMDSAAQIFDSNNPSNVLAQLQAVLSGSPMTGAGTVTGTHKPGTMEKIGMGAGMASDVMGIGK